MPDIMPFVVTFVTAVGVGVFAFAAYWALEIRAALTVALYRRQALWVGAIGAYFALFFISVAVAKTLGVGGLAEASPAGIARGVLIYLGAVMFFEWVDSTIRVARRSDPLRRNTLKWSSLRWILGFFVFVGTFLALIFNAATALNLTQATPLYGPVGLVLFLGAIALYKSAKRSADPVLRRHLIWFGLFAGFLWLTAGIEGTTLWQNLSSNPSVDAIGLLLFVVSGYFLYRSARSLVPLLQAPPVMTQPKP